MRSLTAVAPAPETAELDYPTAPRDLAISFLNMGAEIEHALMAQYLYAGYSLSEAQPDEGKRALVKKWKSLILEIAREEMGHLATVQNMLTLIGGPLSFEREDYPIVDADLWPFPFELEPLTKDSLAKYVLAEMPSWEVLVKLGLDQEFKAIEERLKVSEGETVNRVGLIYAKILNLFTAGPMIQGPDVKGVHPYIATVDIQASSLRYQASASTWGLGYKQILVETAFDRNSALAALTKVSIQGEGPLGTDDSHLEEEFRQSHCFRFLEIYREFPETCEWRPARPVASNPTTDPDVDDPNRRIRGEAEKWAALSNLRYRMLLIYLKHSFCVEVSAGSTANGPVGALVSLAFGEMYNIRSLSEILMSMPLNEVSDLNAGPPLEMPYTLALPTRAADRWRTHRDLLMASLELTEIILKSASGHQRYLKALAAADKTALEQVNALIGA